MKTLVLATVSTAALFFAGAASAQVAFPFGLQPNSQGDATVASSIDQLGTNNRANVAQDSFGATSHDTSVIVQGFIDTTGPRNNSANVTQTGTGQRSLVMQRSSNNATSVNQSGANNDAFTYQSGRGGNTASTTQSSVSGNPKSGNIAGTDGVGSYQGGFALASTLGQQSQDQVENAVTTTGINPPTDLGQDGASYIVQAFSAYSNNASVNQSGGPAQRAAISQVDGEHNSTAAITQTAGGGLGADAWVYQTAGSGNNAAVNQGSTNSSASIYQKSSIGSIASETQAGTFQAAYTTQTGQFQQSYANQSGSFNQLRVTQSGDSNYSNLIQSGSEGTATVTQAGTLNNSYLAQTSQRDVADVTQTGNQNVSNVTQALANGWSHVSQNGTSNNAYVAQRH